MEEDGGKKQGEEEDEEEEELSGRALREVARAAWAATGEGTGEAARLAEALLSAAESRMYAPCLTLSGFRALFSRMAVGRAAATAAREALARAHMFMRAGDNNVVATSAAAAALAIASRTASGGGSGSSSEEGRNEQHSIPPERPHQTPPLGCSGGVRQAAQDSVKEASVEDPGRVLAPRCCIQVREMFHSGGSPQFMSGWINRGRLLTTPKMIFKGSL